MLNMNAAQQQLSRRAILGRSAHGLGAVALASLLNPSIMKAAESVASVGGGSSVPTQKYGGVINPLHFKPRAKRVIWLCMAGGPSHLETFDYKPKLGELHGKPMPDSFTKGQPIAQLQGAQLKCYGPQHEFKKFGKSGQEMNALFTKLGAVSDEICIVRSLHTEAINHDPAHTFINTGSTVSGRPSMGSWLWYGLGAAAEDLPGFVVLTSSGRGGQMQPIAARQWSAGTPPSRFQGVKLNSIGEPVLHIGNPAGIGTGAQAETVDAVNHLNRIRQTQTHDPEILTRIAQYEMAFKMQSSVPELVDMSGEPKHVLEAYG